MLQGDHDNAEVACAGRDVLILGSDSHYRLSGGCRSVFVQGRADTIAAELRPGARVSVGGTDVRLEYTLTGPGPAPALSVTGTGSQATPAGAPPR